MQINNISSINVNGSHNNLKRKVKGSEISLLDREVLFLQETHFTTSCEPYILADFKMRKGFYSHGSSNARGVAIMLNLKESFEVIKINNQDSIADDNDWSVYKIL